MYQPSLLSEDQKMHLAEKRAAHLHPTKKNKNNFVPHQPIWFTEDGTPEWSPGFIESCDLHPDSYWLVTEDSKRQLRRNKHDIKPQYLIMAEQCPRPEPSLQVPPIHWENMSTPPVLPNAHSAATDSQAAPATAAADIPASPSALKTLKQSKKKTETKQTCQTERTKHQPTGSKNQPTGHKGHPTCPHIKIRKDCQGQQVFRLCLCRPPVNSLCLFCIPHQAVTL